MGYCCSDSDRACFPAQPQGASWLCIHTSRPVLLNRMHWIITENKSNILARRPLTTCHVSSCLQPPGWLSVSMVGLRVPCAATRERLEQQAVGSSPGKRTPCPTETMAQVVIGITVYDARVRIHARVPAAGRRREIVDTIRVRDDCPTNHRTPLGMGGCVSHSKTTVVRRDNLRIRTNKPTNHWDKVRHTDGRTAGLPAYLPAYRDYGTGTHGSSGSHYARGSMTG